MEIIEALIWLEPNEVDVHSHPKFVGWCPHLCLARGHDGEDGKPLYMGARLEQVRGSETENLSQGQSGEVTFQLIYFDSDKSSSVQLYAPLQSGRAFEIREGAHIVGYGCVHDRFNLG